MRIALSLEEQTGAFIVTGAGSYPEPVEAFGMAGTDKQFIAVANDQDDFEQGASFQDLVDLYMAVMDAITPQGILIQYLP